MTPEQWFARQERGGDPERAVRDFYRALDCPKPEKVVMVGSPGALQEQGRGSHIVEKLQAAFTRKYEKLQSQWHRSGPGRRVLGRCETIARALPGEGSLKLFDLGLKAICRGMVASDPIGLNLERCWSLLYALEEGPRPDWWDPLSRLVRSAGWLVPYDSLALLCPAPLEPISADPPPVAVRASNLWPEHWALSELPHRADGPALTWPDGWSIWAWQGLPVPRAVIEAPDTVRAEDLPSEKLRAILRERRGDKVLNRYHKVTRADIRKGAKPWPFEKEFFPLQTPEWPKLAPGIYYTEYPSGQLRMVARSRQGHLDKWILLEDGQPVGYDGDGEFYYWNGYTEAFGPYCDDEEPTLCEVSFQQWVAKLLKQFT